MQFSTPSFQAPSEMIDAKAATIVDQAFRLIGF